MPIWAAMSVSGASVAGASDIEVGWKSHELTPLSATAGRFHITELAHDAEYYSVSATALPPKTCSVGTTSTRVTSTCCGMVSAMPTTAATSAGCSAVVRGVQAGDGLVVAAHRRVVEARSRPARAPAP